MRNKSLAKKNYSPRNFTVELRTTGKLTKWSKLLETYYSAIKITNISHLLYELLRSIKFWNILSIISHCASRALSENCAHYDDYVLKKLKHRKLCFV